MTPTDAAPGLLIVANTPSANTQTLANAVFAGAQSAAPALPARLLAPPRATADDVLAARAVIVGTTENFGYMSGLIKDFFERVYYPCLDKTAAKPWALYVRAGKDGTGTARAVSAIVGGMRWRQAQPPLMLVGEYQENFAAQCQELGATIAAALDANLL